MMCSLYQLKSYCGSVSFSGFIDYYTTRRANEMASDWSYQNQISSYRGKCKWNVDQGKGNLGWVSEEFELSELELTEYKWLKIGVKFKRNGS